MTFEERAAYVTGLLRAVGADPDQYTVRQLVRMWVIDGFSKMVKNVQSRRE